MADPIELSDPDLMRELMFDAMEVYDAEQKLIEKRTRLESLQQERCIRLILESNSDQKDYDRASAMASLDAMLMDESLSDILQRLTPQLDEQAWVKGEYLVREP